MTRRELAFRFLTVAASVSNGMELITTAHVAAVCGFDKTMVEITFDYLKDTGCVKDFVSTIGKTYPSAFRISAIGYDWLDYNS